MDGTGDLAPLAARTRPLRIAVVTDTYPPEVNGVAMTLGQLVRGLIGRGHAIELVRPRQRLAEEPARQPRLEEVLVRGLAVPRYDAVKLGGHTLHAVALTLIALGDYPALFWLLAPFCLLFALSRIVLGLHYPSDVIAGACIGAAVATLSRALL
jgi:hypothetical protein